MSIIIGHTPQLLNGEESIIGDRDHTESEIDNCIVIFCLDNGILSCIVFNFCVMMLSTWVFSSYDLSLA